MTLRLGSDAVAEMRAAMSGDDFARAMRRGAAMTPAEAEAQALTSLRAALAVAELHSGASAA